MCAAESPSPLFSRTEWKFRGGLHRTNAILPLLHLFCARFVLPDFSVPPETEPTGSLALPGSEKVRRETTGSRPTGALLGAAPRRCADLGRDEPPRASSPRPARFPPRIISSPAAGTRAPSGSSLGRWDRGSRRSRGLSRASDPSPDPPTPSANTLTRSLPWTTTPCMRAYPRHTHTHTHTHTPA